MQFIQTGSNVTKARLLGYIALVFSFFCMVLYLIGFLLSVGEKDALDSILTASFFYIVTISGILAIAMFNFWKYLDIILMEGGIKFKTFFLLKKSNGKTLGMFKGEKTNFSLL